LGDLDVDGRIKLEWILKKYGVRKWTGFILLRTRSSGKPLSIAINLYHLDFILHLQRQVLQYLALEHLHLCLTYGEMWVAIQVAYLSCVTNVWLICGRG
jgi:hypothetical protein